ncbi:DUF2808 domain-containing protein [Aphanothece sacrum]|uniref:DUF2808 domain-containing protein n=1 Tax=Aphanothece sacrum FPU1 TaxID=1920663 RepID=A0A401INT1_APHSA|nr:DUF2808 domain-containing protein [Aphanothece sacrum]GBF82888.1 hypothetical protein AsFPU1_4322 [Aphanothece sacrum FPU1]GBF85978.1 hypothetical protein AsFPU3_3048 [Aphanothece sacrum FPU3]
MKKLLEITSILLICASPILAVELGNGITIFNKSPRLIDMVTTLSSIRAWGANYYVTIELPKNVGESLQKLTIKQSQGAEIISYDLTETLAFEGTPLNRGNSLTVAKAKQNLDTNEITIILDPPVPPGNTITVGLKPKINPEIGGVYLFGITAYPTGEKPQGLYLGPGRLRFYQHSDRFP